jgi:hypothetical protein
MKPQRLIAKMKAVTPARHITLNAESPLHFTAIMLSATVAAKVNATSS